MSPKDITKTLSLPAITGHPPAKISQPRIENCIGFTQVPLGISGPLLIGPATGSLTPVHAAMGTLEGTLVASTSRGAKALSASGGVRYEILSDGCTRDPFITFKKIDDAVRFRREWPTWKDEFIKKVEGTSRFLKVKAIDIHIVSRSLHIFVRAGTGSAAGQNMITFGCQTGMDWLIGEVNGKFEIANYGVEGDMAGDKNASTLSRWRPRGVEVLAWGKVTDEVCRRVLNMSAKALREFWVFSTHGSVRAGLGGVSINADNALAAIMVGTGQDIASIAESSWCHAIAEYDEDEDAMHISMYYPSLVIGTVGGATNLDTQKEGLKIMGCEGPDGKEKLAGLIAGFAMAVDISTLAAVMSNTFTESHDKLFRKRDKAKL